MTSFARADMVALMNEITPQMIVASLTLDVVEDFLRSLGVVEIAKKSDCLICPTICHNPLEEASTMKLYFYEKNKMFHCYTECNENMSIFTLYQKFVAVNTDTEIELGEAIDYVKRFILQVGVELVEAPAPAKRYVSMAERYQVENRIIQLPAYNEKVLDCFLDYPHPLWLAEGITPEVMRKFEISFLPLENKIIIPHRDYWGRLVGIRGRALEEEDIALGKYRPIYWNGIEYHHQLMFSLYGLYQHKEAITKFKRAILYEGEKSVMLDEVYNGEYSLAVACCGSSINKYHIALLTQLLGVNEIVVALDKEYTDPFSEEGRNYWQKLYDICDKYKSRAKMSFIWDHDNLLGKKDAPIDKGIDVFRQLYKDRVFVR